MYFKRNIKSFSIYLFLAVLIMGIFGGVTQEAQAAEQVYNVYYMEGGKFYRQRTDGKSEAEQLASNISSGRRAVRVGDYLIYLTGSDALMRTDLRATSNVKREEIDSSVYDFDVKNGYVYYTKKAPQVSKYRLYRLKVDVDVSKSGYASSVKFHEYEEEVATNLDYPYLKFKILGNKVYYNAMKDGREMWVACKNLDGSGSPQWICKGAFENSYYATTTTENLYMIVNTDPDERQYSTDCMVLYMIDRKTGKATAMNSKNPIDHNAVTDGGWAGQVFYYNTGIKMVRAENSFDEYPSYSEAKGFGISMSGHRFSISELGAIEMVNTKDNTYVYCDRNGDVYSVTIQSGKVSNKKKISGVSQVYYVRNLKKDGKRASTLLAGNSGTYLLDDNMKATKLIGVNWNIVYLFDDIDGILYSNAGDENRLYWMSADGKTNNKISSLEPSGVLYIEPIA